MRFTLTARKCVALVTLVAGLGLTPALAAPSQAATSTAASTPSACTLPAIDSPAVTALHQRLAAAATQKVRLLALGSSTTFGMDLADPSQRWTDQFMDGLKADGVNAVPGSYGPVSSQALSQAAGALMINGAIPGAIALTSLLEYAPGLAVSVLSGNMPSVVIHVIGSNDYWLQEPPALFGVGLQTTIRALNLQPVKPIQIIVSTYRDPATTDPAKPWSEYQEEMQDIAASDPSHLIYVNLTSWFDQAQVPGADPYGLLDSGGVHPSPAGQAMIAKLLLQALGYGC